MKAYNREEAMSFMNMLGESGEPFLFVINFDMDVNYVLPVSGINPNVMLYNFQGFTNIVQGNKANDDLDIDMTPVPRAAYNLIYKSILQEIHEGNSYLINLTFPTRIEMNMNLREIYTVAAARYKLWLKDRFVVFSPETFVRIKGGIISSYPMKGTIDAAIENAEEVILSDIKETAEHNTIVDLIRNDLSSVAKNVQVIRFRYIDRLKTNCKELLQVRSEISGELPEDYQRRIGNIIFALLPAGSVTGAPKAKTVEIIRRVETYVRGFYTGIAGYSDGRSLDSMVMIRFIEQDADGNLYYKSGGGITAFSDAEKEYDELIDKIYVPVI